MNKMLYCGAILASLAFGSQAFCQSVSGTPGGSVTLPGAAGTQGEALQGITGGLPISGIAGVTGSITLCSGTTAAAVGTSPVTAFLNGLRTAGFMIQNNGTASIFVSQGIGAGVTLTAANSFQQIAAGATWISPDWWPLSGTVTVAATTAVAEPFTCSYK